LSERREAFLAAIGLRYTRQINRREGWTGYLWRGRFASFAGAAPGERNRPAAGRSGLGQGA